MIWWIVFSNILDFEFSLSFTSVVSQFNKTKDISKLLLGIIIFCFSFSKLVSLIRIFPFFIMFLFLHFCISVISFKLNLFVLIGLLFPLLHGFLSFKCFFIFIILVFSIFSKNSLELFLFILLLLSSSFSIFSL